ncbi:MAG: hypothetical protein WEC59_03440 [Salibacteraceae bacterium]
MNRVFVLVLSLLTIASCVNPSEEKESIDSAERPKDWSSEWRMILQIDTQLTDQDKVLITEWSSTKPIQELADQLYKLSFSGDAEVFAPDLFGSLDSEQPLNPKALLDELESFDTVLVEDIFTGEMKDTVVDNTFGLSKLSAMILEVGINDQNGIQITPRNMAFGAQVFDENTGHRRGESRKFYMAFSGNERAITTLDNLKFYSDSLGVFYPAAFHIYKEETSQSFKAYLIENFGASDRFELRFEMSLSFRDAELSVENLQLRALDEGQDELAEKHHR